MHIITEELKRLRAMNNEEESTRQIEKLSYLEKKLGSHRIIGVLIDWLPTAALRDFNDHIIDFFSLGELREEAIQARLEKETNPENEADVYFWEREFGLGRDTCSDQEADNSNSTTFSAFLEALSAKVNSPEQQLPDINQTVSHSDESSTDEDDFEAELMRIFDEAQGNWD